MFKTYYSVKCFGKRGGLIWEEKACTKEAAQKIVTIDKSYWKNIPAKMGRPSYEIEKVVVDPA